MSITTSQFSLADYPLRGLSKVNFCFQTSIAVPDRPLHPPVWGESEGKPAHLPSGLRKMFLKATNQTTIDAGGCPHLKGMGPFKRRV